MPYNAAIHYFRSMSVALLQQQYSLHEIRQAAQHFWAQTQGRRVFAFSGTLGAGKTTFIHALCEVLGVTDVVSSPTFALINEYHFNKNNHDTTIYHMDWYRLRDADEAIDAGMEDCLLQQDVYCFVEWPEKAPSLLQAPYVWIEIEAVSETERRMKVTLK